MSKSNAQKLTLEHRRLYQVLQAPVITEKSTQGAAHMRYSFVVHPDATKPEIAQAVEALFKVQVASVNVSNRDGKVKRFRGRLGRQAATRKAVVKLKSGSIDFGGKI